MKRSDKVKLIFNGSMLLSSRIQMKPGSSIEDCVDMTINLYNLVDSKISPEKTSNGPNRKKTEIINWLNSNITQGGNEFISISDIKRHIPQYNHAQIFYALIDFLNDSNFNYTEHPKIGKGSRSWTGISIKNSLQL